jgi:hypothetical protein
MNSVLLQHLLFEVFFHNKNPILSPNKFIDYGRLYYQITEAVYRCNTYATSQYHTPQYKASKSRPDNPSRRLFPPNIKRTKR